MSFYFNRCHLEDVMKLLIVDDEIEILKKITILAESHGHSVKSATSVEGLQQILKAKSFYPHVIILDRILNGVDSIHFIADIKTAFADSRLLIVSAIDTASEKASALDAGADDYLAKPFSAVELMARIHALTRRKNLYDERTTLQIKNLILNKEERVAKVQDKRIAISFAEGVSSFVHVLFQPRKNISAGFTHGTNMAVFK